MQKSHRSPFLSNITQLSNRLKETIFSSRPLATANICNVVLMRNHELFTGIEVKDKDGNVVGTSKIAARKVFIIHMRVRSRWLDIGKDLFSVSVHKHKKEQGQYPTILTEQAWPITDLLFRFRGNFSCRIQWVVPSRYHSA